MNNNLLNLDDFADILDQLNEMGEVEERPLTEEELASQRRYDEIIKKHKHDNDDNK